MDDDEPITRKLRGLRADRDRQRAYRSPRVQTGAGGARYFIILCPHCGTSDYQHLEPLTAPVGTALRLELASCESCGVLTSWRVLELPEDGSERVLGPDWGAEGPPTRTH